MTLVSPTPPPKSRKPMIAAALGSAGLIASAITFSIMRTPDEPEPGHGFETYGPDGEILAAPTIECDEAAPVTLATEPDLAERRPRRPPSFRYGTFDPVVVDGVTVCYVAYSARTRDGITADNVATETLWKQDADSYVLFGTGYGDTSIPGGGPLNNAAYDMAVIDGIVRNEMGIAAPHARIVVPHGHLDHINAPAVRELRLLGHEIDSIEMHGADSGLVSSMPGWTTEDSAAFTYWIGSQCTEVARFNVEAGSLGFRRRAPHTPGSIDAILDVGGNTAKRVLVYGSQPGNQCAGPSGAVVTIPPHGNLSL